VEARYETGTVEYFFRHSHHGFIKPDRGVQNLFVHGRNVAKGLILRGGERVQYAVVESVKKPGQWEAIDVSLVAAQSPSA